MPHKISLCMIVRNEAALIEDCLRSLRDYVGEMIVVDTGSTDGTPDLARGCGAQVFHFSWAQDFSKARNYSIEQASGDWILVIDADERISERDLKKLSRLVQIKEAKAFAFMSRNYLTNPKAAGFKPCRGEYSEELQYPGYFENSKVFLFRNFPSIRFQGVVHESVLKAVEPDLYDGEIVVHHYGHVISEDRNSQKRKQYIDLGLSKIQADPRNCDAHYELGLEFQSQGNTEAAVNYFQQAYALQPERAEIAGALSSALLKMGNLEKSKEICIAILNQNPKSEEAWARLGTIAMRTSDWENAVSHFQKALELNPESFTALRNSALCLCALHRPHEAQPLFEWALKIAPQFIDLRFELAACLIQTGNLAKAKDFNRENIKLFGHEERFQKIEQTLQTLAAS